MRCCANGWPGYAPIAPPTAPRATATTCRCCRSSSPDEMLDKPISGRVFFEQVIRDNLDIGRPDQVALVFDRRLMRRGPRATPGPFRTRVITNGVTPSLHVDYKHTRVKQYHRRAKHYGPRRRSMHHRLLDRETTDQSAGAAGDRLYRQPAPAARPSISRDPITGTDVLHAVTAASPPPPGPVSPACAGGTTQHALLAALPLFRLQPTGSPTRICARHRRPAGLAPDQLTIGHDL